MSKNITWFLVNCLALLPICTDCSIRLINKYNVPFPMLLGCGIFLCLALLLYAYNTNNILQYIDKNSDFFYTIKKSIGLECATIYATSSLITFIFVSSIMAIYISYCFETFFNVGFDKIILSSIVLFIASVFTYMKIKFNLVFIRIVGIFIFLIMAFLVVYNDKNYSVLDFSLNFNFVGSFVIYKVIATLLICATAFDPFKFETWDNNNKKGIYFIALIMGVVCLALLYIERFTTLDLKDHAKSLLFLEEFNLAKSVIFKNIASLFVLIVMFICICSNMKWFVSFTEILAKEKFFPTIFKNTKDNFMFGVATFIIFIISFFIIILSKGKIDVIISVLPIGIFISITLSYFAFYKNLNNKKAKYSNLIACALGLILLVPYIIFNIRYGTWCVLLFILLFSLSMININKYYISVEKSLYLDKKNLLKKGGRSYSLVVISYLNKGVLPAVNYAKAISSDCRALYITDDYTNEKELFEDWEYYFPDVPFVTIKTDKNKNIIKPILNYIDYTKKSIGSGMITVVLPEYVPKKFYHAPLHRNYAFFLRVILGFKRGIITTTIPYWSE